MKFILTFILFCLFCTNSYAQDDRYFDSRIKITAHKQQVKVVKKKHIKYVREYRTRRLKTAVKYEGETYSPDPVQWATKSLARVAGEVIGGRPNGCPSRAWCGCWLSKHLGIARRDLWLARNWASVGAPAAKQAGVVVVWRHHVGLVTDVSASRIKVLSGNDGHRVRNRWRSLRGIIAFRRI